ncbi:MAG: hypothetical protein Q4G36_03705 [Paracoccus sp. (in: a-proteobacteria)]|nr:hypothetical protein [Paracoccus sp. (in: a-proteobacteria)]
MTHRNVEQVHAPMRVLWSLVWDTAEGAFHEGIDPMTQSNQKRVYAPKPMTSLATGASRMGAELQAETK